MAMQLDSASVVIGEPLRFSSPSAIDPPAQSIELQVIQIDVVASQARSPVTTSQPLTTVIESKRRRRHP